MRVLFAGSPAIAVPAFKVLSSSSVVELAGLLTNPDSAKGRSRKPLPTELAEAALANCFAGKAGRALKVVFQPLGVLWKLSAASITGFAAKEVIVSTLGIMYSVGSEEAEDSASLQDALAADPEMSPLVAFVFMLFTLVIPPCFAALGAIRAELGWKWLAFEVVFLLIVGWVLCFTVFQVGSLFV
jgi:ferrous iron transport protein B